MSAWRQPMVWLAVALPASSVAAGIVLLVLAGRGGAIDRVADPVRRTAQVQVADLSADLRARTLGLRATMRVDGSSLEIQPIAGAFDPGRPLVLLLRHPVDASRDRRLVLAPSARGWNVRGAFAARHDWVVSLSDADGDWRLQGRWRSGSAAASLEPALP